MAEQAPKSEVAENSKSGTASSPSADSATNMAEAALNTASAAAKSIETETTGNGQSKPASLPDLDLSAIRNAAIAASGSGAGLDLLDDVTLNVKIELGRTRMFVEDVLRLSENSVVELDKAAGDPVDIFVNDRHVARGEVLVLNENFCVRVSEIIQKPETGD
jgi:flagellar motor switch protein FliN/FliY